MSWFFAMLNISFTLSIAIIDRSTFCVHSYILTPSCLSDGFIVPGMFLPDFIFHFKETVDIHDSLNRWLGIIKLLSLWNRINQVSAYVRPACGPLCIRHFIIAAVPVTHQVSTVPFQEFHGIVSSARWSVFIKDDWRTLIFTTAEQSHIGLCLRAPPRFLQHLDWRFVRHRK